MGQIRKLSQGAQCLRASPRAGSVCGFRISARLVPKRKVHAGLVFHAYSLPEIRLQKFARNIYISARDFRHAWSMHASVLSSRDVDVQPARFITRLAFSTLDHGAPPPIAPPPPLMLPRRNSVPLASTLRLLSSQLVFHRRMKRQWHVQAHGCFRLSSRSDLDRPLPD